MCLCLCLCLCVCLCAHKRNLPPLPTHPWFVFAALSLCHDESTTQNRMLRAAEGIGHAMADLVQATADSCYM